MTDDAILVANETVEDYGKSIKSGLDFKIDFEKACDHVVWDFLDIVMEAKGFGQRCRHWLMGCLQLVSFSSFLNGRPRGKIQASRGLIKGTLFLLFFLLWW